MEPEVGIGFVDVVVVKDRDADKEDSCFVRGLVVVNAVRVELEQEDWQNDDDAVVVADNSGSHAGWLIQAGPKPQRP